MIECNEISQSIAYLLTAFQDCSKLKASDMQMLVEVINAVYNCDTGPNYNTILNDLYEPIEDELVRFESNDFHAISVTILEGSIEYNGATLTVGSHIAIEFSTLNKLPFEILVKANSRVLVERIVQDITVS